MQVDRAFRRLLSDERCRLVQLVLCRPSEIEDGKVAVFRRLERRRLRELCRQIQHSRHALLDSHGRLCFREGATDEHALRYLVPRTTVTAIVSER